MPGPILTTNHQNHHHTQLCIVLTTFLCASHKLFLRVRLNYFSSKEQPLLMIWNGCQINKDYCLSFLLAIPHILAESSFRKSAVPCITWQKWRGAWGKGDELPLRLQGQHSHRTLQSRWETAQMNTQKQPKIRTGGVAWCHLYDHC